MTDLRAHLRADPARVAECSACIEVLKVNQRTLELYGATTWPNCRPASPPVFRDDMLDAHIEELGRLWDGQLRFGGPTVNYTLQGRRLDILLNATVLPGHEHDLEPGAAGDRGHHRAQQRRSARCVASEAYARGLFEHSPVSLWVEDFSAVKRLLEEVRSRRRDRLPHLHRRAP